MGYSTIEEVAEQVKSWEFINNLPEELCGFRKQLRYEIKGQVLFICSYENEKLRAGIDITYTCETFDYILCQRMGMNEFRDIRFIFKESERFAAEVTSHLQGILEQMVEVDKRNLGYLVAEKGILTWDYGNNLPDKLGPYDLYIKPQRAIRHINGSIIFLDYTNFQLNDQFVVLYNCLRDEIFAELKIAGVFQTTRKFDCRTLAELENCLKKYLQETLDYIAQADHEI